MSFAADSVRLVLALDAVQMNVLPMAKDLGYEVIALVVRSSSRDPQKFMWLQDERPGMVKPRLPTREFEVYLQNRFDFGLLTPPKSRAGKK